MYIRCILCDVVASRFLPSGWISRIFVSLRRGELRRKGHTLEWWGVKERPGSIPVAQSWTLELEFEKYFRSFAQMTLLD